MAKEGDLLRDIAKLFVKYDAEEWQAVIALLRTGGPALTEIATTIEEIQAASPRRSQPAGDRAPRRKAPGRAGAASAPPIPENLDSGRSEVLARIYGALRAREVLPGAAVIRDAYVRMGGKDALPAKRDDAVRVLIRHMAELPQPAFEAAIRQIGEQRSDLQSDYLRWFDMIYKRGSAEPGAA